MKECISSRLCSFAVAFLSLGVFEPSRFAFKESTSKAQRLKASQKAVHFAVVFYKATAKTRRRKELPKFMRTRTLPVELQVQVSWAPNLITCSPGRCGQRRQGPRVRPGRKARCARTRQGFNNRLKQTTRKSCGFEAIRASEVPLSRAFAKLSGWNGRGL